MKILLFVDKLYGGGGERVASILLNHLCKEHDVSAIIFNDKLPTYQLNPQIQIDKITIVGKRRIIHPIERIVKIRKAIKENKPDLVISFMVGLNMYVLLTNLFTRKKLILSEQTSIQAKQKISRIITRHVLYRLASKVVFVSESDCKYAKWLRNRTFIYNPLSCTTYSNNKDRENTIVAISSQRRWHVKGFDLLIEAWRKIAQSHPDWNLQFVGATDGTHIYEMVKAYGLENQVDFLGWSDEIDKTLQTKSIFVLSSRREGFPCCLLEAMSQGCACVAFDCKTGPNEIITDGKNGLLATNGDVDDLASKMKLLIENEPLRQQLAVTATESVHRFEKEKIMQQWDELIQLTVGQ
ncbi:MAG: glycosyltransferase family 4 protein [Salinivirgaceae bacterium]|nr:glycosyltransferase family 4 protein [Salinivirgaceae bacterium]